MKIFKLEKNINTKRGFSIMETLVAIFVLLISVTGPMVFSQNGLRASFQARDQITAFYLAQDAIEYIKARRGHNVLSDNDWLSELSACQIDEVNTSGCTIDTTKSFDDINSIKLCDTSNPGCFDPETEAENDNPLKIDTAGYFGFVGDDSKFSRVVYIKTMETDEVEVVVKIRWTSHDTIGSREITVVENIFNWPDELIN